MQNGHLVAEGNHILGTFMGKRSGSMLIVLGGIHGNEPAGVLASRQILEQLDGFEHAMSGDVVFIAGNSRGLRAKKRYVDSDLNRHWTDFTMERALAASDDSQGNSEDLELAELFAAFSDAIDRARGAIYFLDLHTSSAGGQPFATIGDTLRNRSFAMHFPTPIILGLEEQLDGTLLEFLNNHGLVTMGFEAGQHDDPHSVDNHVSVVKIAMAAAGILPEKEIPGLDSARAALEGVAGGQRFIEVRERHPVRPGDQFEMKPGFENFDRIRKGDVLASDWRGPIAASETGMVLLPLYQKLGDDGFFLARDVKRFWFNVSALLRTAEVGRLMHWLPGVRRQLAKADVLIVNTRVARFFPLHVFHLLGYRKLRWVDDFLVVSKRSYDRQGPKVYRLLG